LVKRLLAKTQHFGPWTHSLLVLQGKLARKLQVMLADDDTLQLKILEKYENWLPQQAISFLTIHLQN